MPNQDLIYRIARTVYDVLGDSFNEQKAERLVAEIYREVASFLEKGDNSENPPKSGSRLIVSVFGVDHEGIVASVANVLAQFSCNIVDINQTVVQGKFAMMIVVETKSANLSIAEIKEKLRNEGEKFGVRIYAQREDLFNAMHRI